MTIQYGTLQIFDQPFIVNMDNGGIQIYHKEWHSILGFGKTMNEALDDLFNNIKNISPMYCNLTDVLLTRDGIEMRNWLNTLVFESEEQK